MEKRISIGLSLLIAAVLTHGLVYSGINLNVSKLMPTATYQGFFERMLVAAWAVWAQLRGFEPMSHLEEFGRFYAYLVILSCPLIGFGIFCLGSRQKISEQWWKPFAIAILFTAPLGDLISQSFWISGLDRPVAEAARATIVLLLMIGSVGGIQITAWRPKVFGRSATA